MPNQISEVLFALMLLTSFGLWGRLGYRWSRLSPRKSLPEWLPRREACRPDIMVLGCIAWTFVPPVVASLFAAGAGNSLRRIQLNVASQATVIAIVGSVVLMTGSHGSSHWRERLSGLRLGLTGFLLSVLPVYALMWALGPYRTDQSEHPFLKMIHSGGARELVVWVFLSAVILAPMAEELIFRVVLQGGLQTVLSPPAVIWGVAVVFCGIHASSVERIPDAIALFPLALILGVIYQRSSSYVAVVTMHLCFNLSNLLFSLSQVE